MTHQPERSTMIDRRQHGDPYWQEDQVVGPVPINGAPVVVRLQVHRHWERGPSLMEFLPLVGGADERLYVHAQPYVLRERSPLHQPLRPTHRRRQTPSVVGREEVRVLGKAQGWCLPQIGTAVLWQCLLYNPADGSPSEDPLLAALWNRFEHLLLEHVPSPERVLTPLWRGADEAPSWAAFLEAHGYRRLNAHTYLKDLHDG